jgi:dihydrofolate reductase
MGRIVVSTNVTLDGIGQDPTGEEGFELGGWFLQISDADRSAWAAASLEEARHAEALLLGGRTYGWFAPRWVSREGEMADLMRALPKYVVRTGEGRLDWGDTTVLDGDLSQAVTRLRDTYAGEVLVYASYELVHGLMKRRLVDEVRVIVFPRVLGSGGRLFDDLDGAVLLHLTRVERVGEELVHLAYDVVPPA